MLLWLQRRAKVTQVWIQFFMTVLLLHLTILLILFLRFASSQVYHFSLNRSLARSDAPVLFMPFDQKLQQKQKTVSVKSQKVAQKPKAEPKKVQKQAPKKTTPVIKKLADKKEETAPKVDQKVVPKKVTEKVVEKKTVPQEKKPEPEQHIPKPAIQDSSLAEPVAQQVHAVVPIINADELEQLAMYEFISAVIGPRWKSPSCGDNATECQIKFLIGEDCKITAVEVVKSSGILLFDLAARNACAVSERFPIWARLKEFCITMKV